MTLKKVIKGRTLAIQKAQSREVGCFTTGLRCQFGNNVSKSNRKTKRIWKQNISVKNLKSDILGNVRVKISRRGERTIVKYGGIDAFLLNYKKNKLTLKAQKMRKELLLRMSDEARAGGA